MSTPRSARPLALTCDLGEWGPFGRMEAGGAERLFSLGELVTVQAGHRLVHQYHRAESFFLLMRGEVEFSLEVAGQQHGVGRSTRPWTPVGWSGFRAPFRYATTVGAVSASELLHFRLTQLQQLFDAEPHLAADFFQALAEAATVMLVDVRELLLGSLGAESRLRFWREQPRPARDATRRPGGSQRRSPETFGIAGIRGSEAMVTNAAPAARELLRRSPFFQDFPDQAVELIAQEAKTTYFCRGEQLSEQGVPAEDLVILAGGGVRLEYRGRQGTVATLRNLGTVGDVLGFCLLDGQRVQQTTVRAVRDGAVIRVPSEVLRRLFAVYPQWGRLYGQQCLWLISRHLQATRAHLIGEAFDREFLAVDNLIEQSKTQLAVSSELHKVPHLLRAAVTLGDALRIVDAARERGWGVEAHVAGLCHELLSPVRREQRFFLSLQQAFEQVVSAPIEEPPERLRKRNAETFIKMFSQIPSRIEGWENLPERSGHIFLFNHLRNHECNSLPNGFQLTLDSHFISAMVLHRHYGDPGVRVVRQSRAGEYGHQDYYSRLGHVAVYTRESDEPTLSRDERVRVFVETAGAHLREGTNLLLAPEGTSFATEESPGPFKAGAFRLAASLVPEPYIVPVAVAFFDRRLDRAVLGVVIDRPWRFSERVSRVDDPGQMRRFLAEYREEYRALVGRAPAGA